MKNPKAAQDEATFNAVSREIHTELGGKASTEEVARLIIARHPELHLAITWGTVKAKIGKALSRHDSSGLPWAASVDHAGTYVQRALFDAADYQSVIMRYAERSSSNIEVARGLALECSDVHDVHIDVDSIVKQMARIA